MSRVTIERDGAVAVVTLNRPEKKNALDHALFDEIFEAGQALRAAKGLRAAVLTGAGDSFCAGIDTSGFMEMAGRIEETRRTMIEDGDPAVGNRFQRPCMIWQELPVPVIGAVNGVAFGAGTQLALACDFRFGGADTRMSVMESRWGLVPDMGITQFLPQIMPADKAKDLIMTARIVEAQECLDLGLLTWLSEDPLSAAMDYARVLASRSPDAIRASKRLVDEAWGQGREHLRLEGALQASVIGYENQIEAVMAGMQKRDATYKD